MTMTSSLLEKVSTLILAFLMVAPVMSTAVNLTDPCNNYTVLNDAWRSVNNTNNTNVCDWYVSWSGWYRFFINGLSAHIPDTCVALSSCGTSFPLWIRGGHPTVEDGVVTRDVCANAYTYCCFFPSYPIRVKACPGNYYVYELLKPAVCNSTYCADVGSVIISSTAATPVIITPDPCYNYTVLSGSWRANSSQPSKSVYYCDRLASWSGWYRLIINGLSAQIPDTCVEKYSCGTAVPLWIRGGHPTVEDGVVTRDVCGHWDNYCCHFGSYPIRVKACPGNYYVYELLRPTTCTLAYCAANLTDPCNSYTMLNNSWRSVNNTNNTNVCDWYVSWSGWYRLFNNGLSAHIPDTCVAEYSCGTHVPLWIRGGHPTVEDGVVTRDVCGNAYGYCCFFPSYPIRVKACPGNYYVYELQKPAVCNSAYCADVGSVIISSTAATPVIITPDPCYNYTVLSDSWRANSSQPSKSVYICDQSVSWSGWYRLIINGLSAQIPDTCVEKYSCGTHVPLWIRGGHPTVKDGVVTRDVCGHWDNYCCHFGSFPIRVKACPGNYYVYELLSPTTCFLAYCAVVSNMSSTSTTVTPQTSSAVVSSITSINTTVTPQTSSAESSSSWVLITAGISAAAFLMFVILMVFMLISRKRVTPSEEQNSKGPQPQHSAVEPPEIPYYMTLYPNSTCPEYNTLDIMKRSSENTKSSDGQDSDYYSIVN